MKNHGQIIRNRNDGTYTVEILGTEVDNLVKCKQLDTVPVTISLHKYWNKCRGTIFHYNIKSMPAEEIKLSLQKYNVTHVEKPKRDDGKGTKEEFELAVITFQSQELPKTIDLEFMKDLSVVQYKPRPFQCKRCYGFGHGQTKCKEKQLGTRRCGWCGKDHHCTLPEEQCKGRDCETCQTLKCKEEPTCINCLGNHPAWNSKCPRMEEEQHIATIQEEEKLSYFRARKVFEERKNHLQTNSYTAKTKQSEEQTVKWFHEQNCKNEETISELQKQIHDLTAMVAQLVAILAPMMPAMKQVDANKAALLDSIVEKLNTKYKQTHSS